VPQPVDRPSELEQQSVPPIMNGEDVLMVNAAAVVIHEAYFSRVPAIRAEFFNRPGKNFITMNDWYSVVPWMCRMYCSHLAFPKAITG